MQCSPSQTAEAYAGAIVLDASGIADPSGIHHKVEERKAMRLLVAAAAPESMQLASNRAKRQGDHRSTSRGLTARRTPSPRPTTCEI